MDRVAACAYLDVSYGPMRDVAGVAAGDWDAAIDAAFVALGETPTNTAPAASAYAYRTVLDYTALRFLYRRVLSQVDMSLDGPQMSKSRSQAVKQVKEAMDAARLDALPLMASVDTTTWSVGSIGVGLLEPEETYA